jgi:hypothetical protein
LPCCKRTIAVSVVAILSFLHHDVYYGVIAAISSRSSAALGLKNAQWTVLALLGVTLAMLFAALSRRRLAR